MFLVKSECKSRELTEIRRQNFHIIYKQWQISAFQSNVRTYKYFIFSTNDYRLIIITK